MSKSGFRRVHFSLEAVSTAAAAIIALAALTVSVWSGFEQRNHNKLSVRPLLSIRSENFYRAENIDAGLFMKNAGTGPAIIESFTIFVDGKAMDKSGFGGWDEALHTLGINAPWVAVYYFPVGTAINVGDEVTIISLSDLGKKSHNEQRAQKFSKALTRVEISVEYSSVYKEMFSVKGFSSR